MCLYKGSRTCFYLFIFISFKFACRGSLEYYQTWCSLLSCPLTLLSKYCSNFLILGFFIFHSEVKKVNISIKNVISKSITFIKKVFWEEHDFLCNPC